MRSRRSPSQSTLRVRAPATTANLGPGFDCAAVAVELWNELEVSAGDGEPDLDHLGVRAFSRLAEVEGRRFAWTNRIPQARGLGSSASVIALGLVAAAVLERGRADPAELFAEGLELEGHGDNLAAALAGGVCLSWGTRLVRIADRPPAVPIAVIPEATVPTAASRAALPPTVTHDDAVFTAGRATLLGAALATGSPGLFAEALEDRLHEPYRAEDAPLLDAVRERLPAGAVGASLSGSGPTVVVWARGEAAAACEAELAERFPGERILRLRAATTGAEPIVGSGTEGA
jgi:homoserine kinase